MNADHLKMTLELVNMTGALFPVHGKKWIRNSYPNNCATGVDDIYENLLRSSKGIAQSNYKLVIWDLPIILAATNGNEAFVGQPLEERDIPAGPTIWTCHPDKERDYWENRNNLRKEPWFPEWWTPNWAIAFEILVPAGSLKTRIANGLGYASIWVNQDMSVKEDPFRVYVDPGVMVGEPLDGFYSRVVAGSRFLDMPFVVDEPAQLNHSMRKEYKRMNREPPDIRTICLRRTKSTSSGEVEGKREYSCQWMVGGHWRKPSERMIVQRPVYVSPYIKGDPGKPFKPPAKTVFVAQR